MGSSARRGLHAAGRATSSPICGGPRLWDLNLSSWDNEQPTLALCDEGYQEPLVTASSS